MITICSKNPIFHIHIEKERGRIIKAPCPTLCELKANLVPYFILGSTELTSALT